MKYMFSVNNDLCFINILRPVTLHLLLLTLIIPAISTRADQYDIVINEIMYHPQDTIPCGEFLEIVNRGSSPVNLGGWYLQDEQQVMYTLPVNTILNGEDYLVFYNDPNAVECYVLGSIQAFGPYDGKLDNGGEHILLKNASGTLIDEVNYDDDPPWPTEADGAGPSLELIDPAANNNSYANWGLGKLYSPGMSNDPVAPGGGDIVITEIMYKPLKERFMYTMNPFWASNPYHWKDGDDPVGEFIELFNRGAEPINLANWKVTDKEGVLYQFTTSAILNPD